MKVQRGPLEKNKLEFEDVDSKLFESISENFGFHSIELSHLPLPRSSTSRKISFTNLGKLYVLKFMPKYLDDASTYENRLIALHSLSKLFDRAVQPIPARKGRFLIKFGELNYWVSEGMSGTTWNGSADCAISAASAIARLHAAFDTLVIEKTLPSTDSHSYTLRFIEMVKSSAIERGEVDLAEELANECYTVRRFSDRKHSLIHGDTTIPNFLFDCNNSVSGIFDFDELGQGSRARDIATLIVSTCALNYVGTSTNLSPEIRINFDDRLFKQLVTSYINGGATIDESLGAEIVLIWIEMLCLGIVREDFTCGEVKKCLPQLIDTWRAIHINQ